MSKFQSLKKFFVIFDLVGVGYFYSFAFTSKDLTRFGVFMVPVKSAHEEQ